MKTCIVHVFRINLGIRHTALYGQVIVYVQVVINLLSLYLKKTLLSVILRKYIKKKNKLLSKKQIQLYKKQIFVNIKTRRMK